jgi:lipopolysaccharide biosynthesis protein
MIFSGKIFDYKNIAVNSVSQQPNDDKNFLSVMTSWDNTARRKDAAHIYLNSSPELYEFWLGGVIEKTKQVHSGDERLVFINAWNEWAEGAHLEPDIKYGHAYLAATRKALFAQHSWKTAAIAFAILYPKQCSTLRRN